MTSHSETGAERESASSSRRTRVIVGAAFVVLLLNSGWLVAFPSADIFYVTNVLLHVVVGVALSAGLWFSGIELFRRARSNQRAMVALSTCAALGAVLCVIGATRPHLPVVAIHAAFGFVGAGLLALSMRDRRIAACAAMALLLPAYSAVRERWFPSADQRIINPTQAPLSMDYEGGGRESPFFPSAAQTTTGGKIPSDFFLESAACGECHKDVYEQWQSSMHRFSSFNNQFYRKSIEYMQETAGVEASKWCAGCHDHAMLFNGMFEDPVRDQLDTPEAHAGLACVSCHSIVHVPDTMGNGGFVIQYPKLHGLAASEFGIVRAVHNYVTNTAPAAHRRAFLKPFMREDRSEFCASCHKVHLDVPVNGYRWVRGFNSYDNWQASGVSGQGARSFYYPEQAQDCSDCHMPLVPSNDPGSKNGMVRSHRFAAANSAVPYVNQDQRQLDEVTKFLQDGIVSVDIFALSPVTEDSASPQMVRSSGQLSAATSFAVGEEAGARRGPVLLREVGNLAAPLDKAAPRVRPGETVRVDVVVRTRKVGHFFPSGTVDAFDVWVEFEALDTGGKRIFWSGAVAGGTGPVDPGAHFYRALQVDAHGNPIDKRNAFHMRGLLYARLIPPGAADVVHYRLTVPADASGPLTLRAKLNYRKFSHSYTAFAYAGKAGAGSFGEGFDDRQFTYDPADIPDNVPGAIKDRIPVLPIIEMANAETVIHVGARNDEWSPQVEPTDWERWNDYGIGLLLQGDLKGAEHAFQRAVDADPQHPDGWLNVARSMVEEGRTSEAEPFLEKALELSPGLPRALYFRALARRASGDYDGALEDLRGAADQYPRDRVVLNEIANILFLRREYSAAVDVLDRVAEIDPEDLQMHYTRMRCYRGLGDMEAAEREEALFLRYKADESAQTRTAELRRTSPEDNNERQAIHEHVSAHL
ncbi:MAG: tetratricopeptide repeat protein [Bryobacterales bacterium]|nr:tetratricopeptide repeat protein [Bryobacterales bacterium]